MFRVGIITSSDKSYKGEREDLSGKLIIKMVEEKGYQVDRYVILSEEEELLSQDMMHMSDELGLDLILTTGGPGFSMRDVTKDATNKICHRIVPGITEAIRYYSLEITPRAMLSTAVSRMRNQTLTIINMPGSPKAVKEALEYAYDSIHHGLEILTDRDHECARSGD